MRRRRWWIAVTLAAAGCRTSMTVPAEPPASNRTPVVQPTSGPTSRPATTPATAERPIEFPFVEVDRSAREVRVQCEALGLVDTPLEFLCVMNGGPEHEAVLRTKAKPSHIHAGLLLLGMTPGSPVTYDEKLNRWSPPRGPGIRVEAEWTDANGKTIRLPAERLMKSIKAGAPMPPTTFVFTGSHVRDSDGTYLADLTGYVVSICNFEHTPIDVPGLVSSANETLEWVTDLDHGPAKGTPVTLILKPADDAAATGPAEDPHLMELRAERQRLLEDAARIQAAIDRETAMRQPTLTPATTTTRRASAANHPFEP